MRSAERAPKRNDKGRAKSGADDPYRAAMERAGRLLAARPRSTAELRERLARRGCPPDVAELVLTRLTELGLLDDAAFARQWIDERSRSGRAGRALLHELEAKGIAPEVAEAALADAGLDEATTAAALAVRHLPSVADLPLPKQAARLGALLARRGYSDELVEEAVRAVLPPEGWD